MWTEACVYMRHHQGAKVKHFDVSNVIYHKFSQGAISYMLNRENVNVMLEYYLIIFIQSIIAKASYSLFVCTLESIKSKEVNLITSKIPALII